MTLASTKLIPELQYWFNNFVISSDVNKERVLFPAIVNFADLPVKSFIELLFNDSYSESEYRYKFTEVTTRTSWPNIVRQRLLIYPVSAKYYTCDSTGENIFLLQSHDLTLLDALLQYNVDSTSVSIVDSTSVSFINNILYASYSQLNTNLSKLIFIYLDFKINGNTSNYNTSTLIADSTNILESMYETFVLDKIFSSISSQGV